MKVYYQQAGRLPTMRTEGSPTELGRTRIPNAGPEQGKQGDQTGRRHQTLWNLTQYPPESPKRRCLALCSTRVFRKHFQASIAGLGAAWVSSRRPRGFGRPRHWQNGTARKWGGGVAEAPVPGTEQVCSRRQFLAAAGTTAVPAVSSLRAYELEGVSPSPPSGGQVQGGFT